MKYTPNVNPKKSSSALILSIISFVFIVIFRIIVISRTASINSSWQLVGLTLYEVYWSPLLIIALILDFIAIHKLKERSPIQSAQSFTKFLTITNIILSVIFGFMAIVMLILFILR